MNGRPKWYLKNVYKLNLLYPTLPATKVNEKYRNADCCGITRS